MSSFFQIPRLPSRAILGWTFAALCAVAVFTYGPSVANNIFVLWDDNYLINFNPHIKSFSPSNIVYNFTHFDPELYIPLTFLSYQLDYALNGLNPSVFHATNLVVHVLNASLVTTLLFFLVRRWWIAALCGLLFLVHPLNTETVAWASARKDLLSTFFFLGSIIAYLAWHSEGGRGAYLVSLLSFLLGLLSKVLIVPLPVILLLIDMLHGRPVTKRMFFEKIPYFALSVIFGLVALLGKKESLGLGVASPWELALVAFKSTAFYLQKFLLPVDLSVIYPYTDRVTVSSPDFFIPLLIVALLCAAAFFTLRRTRVVFFGVFVYLLTLIPTFFNAVKGFDIYFASDRYAYIPSVALLFLVASAVAALCPDGQGRSTRKRQMLWSVPLGVIAVVFCLLAAKQSEVWKDSESLFTHTIERYPNAVAARMNLATVYRQQKRLDEAEAQLNEALKTKEHQRIYSGLATIAEERGDRAKAYALFRKSIALDPKDPEGYFGLAIILSKDGKIDEALAQYEESLKRDANYVGVHNNIASIYLQKQDFAKAAEHYRKALEIDPYFADASYNLGLIAKEEGKTDEAVAMFERTVRNDVRAVDAYVNLAELYLMQKRTDDAVSAVRSAEAIDSAHPEVLFLLQTFRKHGLIP